MTTSVVVLKKPLILSTNGVSIQVPGMVGSKILALGTHSHILAMVVAV